MATEHLIRLRGGWRWLAPTPPAGLQGYLRLPISWPDGLTVPFRLIRQFGLPPHSEAESVWLRLDDVAGLIGAQLNEQPLISQELATSRAEIALDTLLAQRNALVLEADPRRWPEPPGFWGSIALVVRSS